MAKHPFGYINVDNARTKEEAGDAVCYICLEGCDGREQLLLRDCSCRGSSGWAHFDCLVKYAQKTETLIEEKRYSPDQLTDIWVRCCNCKQDLQNDLCVAMATRYVNFIEEHPVYTRKEWDLLESLKDKQSAHFHSHQDEGKQVSRRILSLLEIVNASNHSGPMIPAQRLLEMEADTYRGYELLSPGSRL